MGTNENQSGGVSRRDLLKKGAVAGGIVWAAPVVLSDVAGADTNVGTPSLCTAWYSLKFETPNGPSSLASATCIPELGAGNICEKYQGRTYGNGCGAVAAKGMTPGGIGFVTLSATFTTPDGVKPILSVQASTKGGTTCADATHVHQEADGSWRIEFPSSAGGNQMSNVQIIFCV